MDDSPRAGEVRTALEATFAGLDPAVGVELIGTLVPDERTLVVLVRDSSTGQVHRTRHDVDEIRVQTSAVTVDRLVDEVLVGAIHYQSLTLRGTDRWGVPDRS